MTLNTENFFRTVRDALQKRTKGTITNIGFESLSDNEITGWYEISGTRSAFRIAIENKQFVVETAETVTTPSEQS